MYRPCSLCIAAAAGLLVTSAGSSSTRGRRRRPSRSSSSIATAAVAVAVAGAVAVVVASSSSSSSSSRSRSPSRRRPRPRPRARPVAVGFRSGFPAPGFGQTAGFGCRELKWRSPGLEAQDPKTAMEGQQYGKDNSWRQSHRT